MSGIGVVIVTYNRLDKLKIALDKYDNQTYKPMYVLVVDNYSNDGTKEFLLEWKNNKKDYQKIVYFNMKNEGGSGGFYQGLEYAKKLDAEWIWISDDDAFPKENALENAVVFLKKNNGENIAAICGMVINHDEIDVFHRRRYRRKGFKIINDIAKKEEYDKEKFEINAFSYVGTIVNKKKLIDVGSTNKEYFIWLDDTEHSYRLSKSGKIYCVPQIIVYHDTVEENSVITWKTYYGIRNELYLLNTQFGLCGKGYAFFKAVRKYSMNIFRELTGNGTTEDKIVKSAVIDAFCGHMGVHRIYRPGWKINS